MLAFFKTEMKAAEYQVSHHADRSSVVRAEANRATSSQPVRQPSSFKQTSNADDEWQDF
jgi:methyl-accepting chemotaxis protein